MGKHYTHLTLEERIDIYVYLKENKSLSEIADLLACHKSTISREIRRNEGKKGYRPRQAQEKSLLRKKKPRTKKINASIIAYTKKKLAEKYSPEQISGRLKKEFSTSVSHEWIYQFIYHDKKSGGTLYKNLRSNNGKKRRKRYGKRDKRGSIPGRIDIDKRAKVIETRARFGDWEADLVSGKNHKGFLVTLVERKSNFTLIGYAKQKTADLVAKVIEKMYAQNPGLPLKSITFDNGKEFCGHQKLAKNLDCQTFFAHPYSSWERGTNENTNGLIRQYFPKKTSFENLKQKEIQQTQNDLNNRPRKKLDFSTPNEKLKKYNPRCT
jgi:IS30 family transposase